MKLRERVADVKKFLFSVHDKTEKIKKNFNFTIICCQLYPKIWMLTTKSLYKLRILTAWAHKFKEFSKKTAKRTSSN